MHEEKRKMSEVVLACRPTGSFLCVCTSFLILSSQLSPRSTLQKMSFKLVCLLTLPLLALAHGPGPINIHARKAAASSAAPSAPPPSATVAGPAAPAGTISAPVVSVVSLTTVPFTLASTNPTAVPIASIVSDTNPPTQATVPLLTTPAAGAVPTYIPNAPPLPDISNFNMNNYPTLDKPPPLDSPEVQAWIQEVANSGIEIPNIPITVLGGCQTNPERIGNMTECWWTCGHCTRSTDITTCGKPDTWGSSYDDGPSDYTNDLLDYLQTNNILTTFFVVGSRVAERPVPAQAEYMLGHQLAVHTWSHSYLTTQTTEEIIAELGWSKKVIKDVIGVTPNVMRPPYGDIDDRVRAIALAMGLTPIIWSVVNGNDFDTMDWQVPGGVVSSSQAVASFEAILQSVPGMSTGFIVLEHDLWPQEVDLTIGYFLPAALAQTPKLTIQPIRQCLGLAPGDAYIETNNNSTNPPLVSASNSTSSGSSGGSTSQKGAASDRGASQMLYAVALAFGLGAVALI